MQSFFVLVGLLTPLCTPEILVRFFYHNGTASSEGGSLSPYQCLDMSFSANTSLKAFFLFLFFFSLLSSDGFPLSSPVLVGSVKRISVNVLFAIDGEKMQLQNELEMFFETANLQGASKVKSLTTEQRAQRTIKGLELEDEIYGCIEQLQDLQSEYLSGSKKVTIEEIKALQDHLNKLKSEYVVLVGAADVPLYFGRLPDQLQ